jgi:hypothetical protein
LWATPDPQKIASRWVRVSGGLDAIEKIIPMLNSMEV